MAQPKVLSLNQVFSDDTLTRAAEIYSKKPIDLHRQLTALVTEDIQAINKRTKMENSPGYLAYVLENAFNQAVRDAAPPNRTDH